MGNSKVVNESGGPHVKYRIKVAVGAAYGSDVDRVRAALMAVAEESDEEASSGEQNSAPPSTTTSKTT